MQSRPLVGRVTELERLERALRRAQAGSGSALLLAGDAGIGKTRLAGELAERARRAGFTVLSGRGIDLIGADLPFLPLVEALRPLGEDVPEFAGDRLRLFQALVDLLDRVSRSAPVLLVLDDLHWADDSTLDAVAFLAHNLAERRAVLVGTYRADELSDGRLSRLVGELVRARVAQVVELGPLGRDELTAVLETVQPGRPWSSLVRIAERAEGNPFYAEELLAASEEGTLPAVLRDVLLQRLTRLSVGDREVLRIAAAAGRDVPYRLLVAAAGREEPSVRQAVRAAVEQGILRPDQAEGRLRFRHALLAEAVYATLVPGELEAAHERVGEALAARPELGTAAELARHWAIAGRWREALAASAHAMRDAEAMGGFAEALRHGERLIDLWEWVDDAASLTGTDLATVLEQTAEHAAFAGHIVRAIELVERAIALAGTGRRAGLLQSRLAAYSATGGDTAGALLAHERAVALVPADPPSADYARVLSGHGRALMLHWRHEPSLATCERALDVARATGARDAEFEALATLGIDHCYLGRPGPALEHLEAARRMALAGGARRDLSTVYVFTSDALLTMGRLREAAAEALEGLERMKRLGVEPSLGTVLVSNAVQALFALGEWDVAAERLERMLMIGGEQWRHAILVDAARLAVGRGELERARAFLQDAEAAAWRDPRSGFRHAGSAAELAILDGAPQRASEALDRARSRLRAPDAAICRAELGALAMRADAEQAALARIRREPLDEVIRHADALLSDTVAAAEAGAGVTPVAAGWRALAVAEHARVGGPADAGAWEAAGDVWERLGHPHRVAYCRLRQAEALVAAGAPRLAAEVPAREAHATAARLGAAPLERELELLAARARLDLEAPAPVGEARDPAGLTPREREVLDLLARGLTNREIADELVISVKTVGVHVSSILHKLDVPSRTEAAAVAHRLARG